MDKSFLTNSALKILSFRYLRWIIVLSEKLKDEKNKFCEIDYKLKSKIKTKSLVVIYRLSSVNSKKSPVFKNDKFKLVKFCLDSFVKSFSGVNYKIVFILDSCSRKYVQLIKKYKKLDFEIIQLKNAGNKKTWFLQLNIAKNLNNCLVYFAEDDYYYRVKAGKKLVEGLKKYDFISLHNQLDDKKLKNGWYKVGYTCLSFGTNSDFLKNNLNSFKKFGTYDYTMWMNFKDLGAKMYSWIPTLATHLVDNRLAKGINWEKEWETVL